MTERTRKILVFSFAAAALGWSLMNMGDDKRPRSAAAEPPAAAAAAAAPSKPAPQIDTEHYRSLPWGRDPFRAKRPKVRVVKPPQKELTWICSGILYNPRSPSAFINGRAVQVGDIVDSAKVVAITRESVTLNYRGREFSIQVSRG